MLKKIKKILSLLILSLCLTEISFAQNDNAEESAFTSVQKDSLQAVFDSLVAQYNKTILSEPYVALEYCAQAQQTALQTQDSFNIALAYRNIGNGYYQTRIYYLAMEMQFKAFDIYSHYGRKEDIAACLLDISKTYYAQQVYDMAEEYCLKVIEICRLNNLPELRAEALLILGRITLVSDEDEAVEDMLLAKHIYDSLGLKEKSIEINIHLANAYTYMDESDSAFKLLKINLDEYKDDANKVNLARTYQAYGTAYESIKETSKATSYYNTAIDIFNECKVSHEALLVRLQLARMQLSIGDYENAVKNASIVLRNAESEELLHGTEEIIIKHNTCNVLYKAYQKLGNQELALKYCERFAQTGDSVYLLKRKEQFSEFQVSMESQRQQKEIEMIQINAEKDHLKLEKEGYTRNIISLVVIILLVIGMAIVLYRRYQEKIRNNTALSQTNTLMEKEIQERKMAEIELKNSEEKYRLLFRKTPIGIIQFNDKFIITTVNERFIQIFGLKNKNLIGQNIGNFLPQRIFKGFNSEDEDTDDEQNESVIKQELDVKTADGEVSVSITLKSYYYNTGLEVEKGGIMIVQDVTERKNAEKNAEGVIVTASSTLAELPDAIFRLDEKADYIYCKIPNVSDSQQKKYIGKNIREMLPADLLLPFLVAFNNVRKSKETQYVDYQANEGKEDEDPIFNEARFSLCDDNTVLVTIRDITRLKHAESKQKSARVTAEEGSQAKTEFLISMSTEIKRPLENILRNCEKLAADVSDAEQTIKLKEILSQASFVNETLTDVLKLTEMDSDSNKNQFTTLLNPVTIAKDVFDIFKSRALEKQLDYDFESDPFTPQKLQIDEIRLRQILFNLLSNAVKFTEKGKVKLRVEAHPCMDQQHINLVFIVSDTGVGLSQEKLKDMMAGDNNRSNGLALSKKMADSMKANITVTTTEGEGSNFSLVIPDLVTDIDVAAMSHNEVDVDSLTQVPDKVISTTRKRNSDALREYLNVLKYAVIPEYKILKGKMSFGGLVEFVSRFKEQSQNYKVDQGVEIADDLLRNIKNLDISTITINTRKLETFILNLTKELQ